MTLRLPLTEALETASALLAATGMGSAEARQSAEAIVLAEVWGIPSHGLMRLPFYLDRLVAGGCDPTAAVTAVSDTGPLAVLDGNQGLGHWQLWRAAELAHDRCFRYGIAAVGLTRSSHCGSLGIYTLPALSDGHISLIFSNGPAAMPPWKGTRPVLSTSPLAAGIPCGPTDAIIDMATSAVARGKIAAHAQRGEPLEAGWAFTIEGEPTTDASRALSGMLAPLGGVKGYALALLVEALSGGLLGPSLSAHVTDMFSAEDATQPQGIGHLVITIDPSAFAAGAAERLAELGSLVADAGGRLPGSTRKRPDDFASDETIDVDEQTWERITRRRDVLAL